MTLPAQLPLYAPLARRTDPATSHLAAASVAGAQQQSECAAILDALRTSFLPLTYKEVFSRMKGRIPEAVEVQRRLDDLRKAGLVVSGPQRRCRESGHMAQVWSVKR